MTGSWNLVGYLIQRLGLSGKSSALFITLAGVIICMVIPYLLGSLNFGLIISRKKYKDDIRKYGSGNAGTTNMLRTYGKGAAIATMAGDMLKAVVAVAIGYLVLTVRIENAQGELVAYDKLGASLAGLFVMLGHMFPCFYKFKGGKGVATAAMVVLMINPIVFIILLLVFVITVVGTKFVSLGSIFGMCLYPIFLTAFEGMGSASFMAIIMACLVLYRHKENIKRLREGKESKISFGKGQKKAVEEADCDLEKDEEKECEFVTCPGCKHLIPATRRGCVYCGTQNPNCTLPEENKKSRRKKKK